MIIKMTTESQLKLLGFTRKIKRAKVEYTVYLDLINGKLVPVDVSRGSRTASLLRRPCFGNFHTHTGTNYAPNLSETDLINLFLSDTTRVIGVGSPGYSVSRVQFAALTLIPSAELIREILDELPGILDEAVHIEGLRNYITVLDIDLGVGPLLLDVATDYKPVGVPKTWWKPKESLKDYIERKTKDSLS